MWEATPTIKIHFISPIHQPSLVKNTNDVQEAPNEREPCPLLVFARDVGGDTNNQDSLHQADLSTIVGEQHQRRTISSKRERALSIVGVCAGCGWRHQQSRFTSSARFINHRW
jgi:hypothetical protein